MVHYDRTQDCALGHVAYMSAGTEGQNRFDNVMLVKPKFGLRQIFVQYVTDYFCLHVCHPGFHYYSSECVIMMDDGL